MNIDVFSYDDPQTFLVEIWQWKKSIADISLRQWSKELGYKNPSLLSETLLGKKRMNARMAQVISEYLQFNSEQTSYLAALVHSGNSKTELEHQWIRSELKRFNLLIDKNSIKMEFFIFISDWYHLAILQLCNISPVSNCPSTICSRLRHKASITQIKAGIDRMLELGYLIVENGFLKSSSQAPFVANFKAPSEAVRTFHQQMISLGMDAIQEQSVDERSLGASTLILDQNGIQEAQKLILQCHDQLLRLSQKTNKHARLMQFNTQFFLLTKEDSSQ